MPSLSICTICQDEEEVIKWMLESCKYVNEQIPDLLKEVVINDGGSRDSTVDIINSYKDYIPLTLIEHPFDNFGQQKNRCLEKCSGEFIFFPDADMSWTSNFSNMFKTNYLLSNNMWDMMLYFTVRDGIHYFKNWPLGPSMRVWKRGPKYSTNFHEKLEGQYPGLPICRDVFVFENSMRQSDKALLNRGERYQRFIKEMQEEGGGPGPVDKYLKAAHVGDEEVALLPDHIRKLILPSII